MQPPCQSPVTYIITSEDERQSLPYCRQLALSRTGTYGQKEKFDVVFCTVGIAARFNTTNRL